MNVPNLISLSRICMTPLFAALYLRGDIRGALGVLGLCAVSDVLDGALARRWGAVTELGKALDPVADKLIQGAMMLCAAARFPEVWLLLAAHLLRELSLGLLGLRVLRVTGRVYGARWYGKLCTAVIYLVMTAALALPQASRALIGGGVLLCAALVLLCLGLYMRDYLRALRRPGGEEAPPSPLGGRKELGKDR